MRVLLITPYYSPGVGGAPRLLQGYVDYMSASGHSIEVLTFGAPLYDGCPEFDIDQSYPIYRVPAKIQSGRTIITTGLRLLTLAARKHYDVIFCGVAYPSALLAYISRCFSFTPYIVYSHGEDATVVKGSTAKSKALGNALRRAHSIMVNSEFTQGEIMSFGIPTDDIMVMPPGIDPAPYEGVDQRSVMDLRRRLDLEGKRVLLTVARLSSPRKGHDTVIKTLAGLCQSIPDLHYLIVGKGDPGPLLDLAKSEGVAKRVTIVDFVPDVDLPALYHLCDVYVMVSRYDAASNEVEGFGMVYLEAAACGKPCVAGSEGGAVDAVVHNVTGFTVSPTSIEDVTAALRTLLIDPERAARMGQAGQQRVRKEFHVETMWRKMEQITSAANPKMHWANRPE